MLTFRRRIAWIAAATIVVSASFYSAVILQAQTILTYNCLGGGTDDTAALNSLIAGSGNNTIINIPCPVYLNSATPLLFGGQDKILRGTAPGAGFFAGPTGPALMMSMSGCARCAITDLIFEGNNGQRLALYMWSASDSIIANNIFQNFSDSSSFSAPAVITSRLGVNNLFENNVIENTTCLIRGMWIGNPGSSNIETNPTIVGNIVRDTGHSGIVAVARGGRIADNFVEGAGTPPLNPEVELGECSDAGRLNADGSPITSIGGAGIKVLTDTVAYSQPTIIEYNTTENIYSDGFQTDMARNMIVRNNTFRNNYHSGIFSTVTVPDSLTIQQNTIQNNDREPGLYNDSSHGGIFLISGGTNVSILNNTVVDTRNDPDRTQVWGIQIRNQLGIVDGITIRGNNCTNNLRAGIRLYAQTNSYPFSNVVMENNICNDNVDPADLLGYGILLEAKDVIAGGVVENITGYGNILNANSNAPIGNINIALVSEQFDNTSNPNTQELLSETPTAAAFAPPKGSAPDNKLLNNLTRLDMYLRTAPTTLQTIRHPLAIAWPTTSSVYIGAALEEGGTGQDAAIYGLGTTGGNNTYSFGAFGYSEGPVGGRNAGVVGKATYNINTFAGYFEGKFGVRGDASGAPDTAFGTSGLVEVTGIPAVTDIATDARYAYVVGEGPTGSKWRIEKRSLSDGELCNGSPEQCAGIEFGSSGIISDNLLFSPVAVALDGQYLYILGGNATSGWRIEKRRASDGQPCNSVAACGTQFDGDGVITIDSGVVGFPGDIIVVGSSIFVGGSKSDGDLYLAKFDSTNGAPVTEFGVGGVLTDDNSAFVRRMASNGDFLFTAVQSQKNIFLGWKIEKRDRVTGAEVTSPAVLPSVGSFDYTISDLVTDGQHIYAAGFLQVSSSPLQYLPRVEKRNKDTLALFPGFGASGFIEGSAGDGQFLGIAVDANAVYLGGLDDSHSKWRFEKRLKMTGARDTTFDGDGVASGPAALQFNTMSLSGVSLVTGGKSSTASGYWMVEKRLTTPADGDIDVEGMVISPLNFATSSLAVVPAVVGQGGIVVSTNANQSMIGEVTNGLGYGIYGYSADDAGLIVSATAGAGSGVTAFGVHGSGGAYGITSWSVSGHGIEARVDGVSTAYAAEGISNVNSLGSYGVYGRGNAFAAIFEGLIEVAAGGILKIGTIEITESGLLELITWAQQP